MTTVAEAVEGIRQTFTPDPLELPVDGKPSKIRGPKPGADDPGRIPGEDPDEPSLVDARVARFRAHYPDGSILTSVKFRDSGDTVVATARVWTHATEFTESRPVAVAHASRSYTDHADMYAHRAMETAESVAISRALRFLALEPAKES